MEALVGLPGDMEQSKTFAHLNCQNEWMAESIRNLIGELKVIVNGVNRESEDGRGELEESWGKIDTLIKISSKKLELKAIGLA